MMVVQDSQALIKAQRNISVPFELLVRLGDGREVAVTFGTETGLLKKSALVPFAPAFWSLISPK